MNGLGSARDTLRRVRFVFPDEIKGTNDMVYMHPNRNINDASLYLCPILAHT